MPPPLITYLRTIGMLLSWDPLEPPQAPHAVAAPPAALAAQQRMGQPSSRRLCGVSLSCQILWAHARRSSSDDRNMSACVEKGYAWSRVHAWSSCSDDAAGTRPFGKAHRARLLSQN